MKFVVIDIETTGLESPEHQILSIGAIMEDTEKKLSYDELPKFHVAILHKEVSGSLFALNMNRELINTIVRYQSLKPEDRSNFEKEHGMKFLQEDEITEEFFHWLIDCGMMLNWDSSEDGDEYLNPYKKIVNGKIYPMLSLNMTKLPFTAAGKNFATFDKKFLEKLPKWNICFKIRQRVIDPAVLYVDWKNDQVLPDLATCKVRANLDDHISHNALEDAWDTLQVLRKFY
jgi:hypothetical protein